MDNYETTIIVPISRELHRQMKVAAALSGLSMRRYCATVIEEASHRDLDSAKIDQKRVKPQLDNG